MTKDLDIKILRKDLIDKLKLFLKNKQTKEDIEFAKTLIPKYATLRV